MQLDLGGLPGPIRHAPGRDQAPARLLERVMVALGLGADVFRALLLSEGIEDRLQRGGAPRGQVTPEPPGAPVVQVEPQRTVTESVVVAVSVRRRGPRPHLLRQPGQVHQRGPGRRRSKQDRIRGVPRRSGQQVAPIADLARPRLRQRPDCQGVPDTGMGRQPPGPRHRGGRSRPGDPGLPAQPGPGGAVPVGLVRAAFRERIKHRSLSGDPDRIRSLQTAQAVGLLSGSQRGRIRRGEEGQRLAQRGERLARASERRGRLARNAHDTSTRRWNGQAVSGLEGIRPQSD